jgi:hypothetical protein
MTEAKSHSSSLKVILPSLSEKERKKQVTYLICTGSSGWCSEIKILDRCEFGLGDQDKYIFTALAVVTQYYYGMIQAHNMKRCLLSYNLGYASAAGVHQ